MIVTEPLWDAENGVPVDGDLLTVSKFYWMQVASTPVGQYMVIVDDAPAVTHLLHVEPDYRTPTRTECGKTIRDLHDSGDWWADRREIDLVSCSTCLWDARKPLSPPKDRRGFFARLMSWSPRRWV